MSLLELFTNEGVPKGDMKWENCKVRHFLAIIRLWNNLININPDRLTKRIYIWNHNLCKNWCKEVKQNFELIEYQEMFSNKLACNMTTVKNKCKEMQNIEWKHLLSTKPNLKTYVKFKEYLYRRLC